MKNGRVSVKQEHVVLEQPTTFTVKSLSGQPLTRTTQKRLMAFLRTLRQHVIVVTKHTVRRGVKKSTAKKATTKKK